jgi:meiotic recombination protein SPO11
MPLFALVDFDPHGVAIMRTYKYGSQRLDHEEDTTASRLRWLGIRSDDILRNKGPDHNDGSQPSQEPSSQESVADVLNERPAKRARISRVSPPSESISPLTQSDRKKAIEIMREISGAENVDADGQDQMRELQRMLMLNIKAEIQAVDSYGDIANWLDSKLGM